jgi:hypothetical protein
MTAAGKRGNLAAVIKAILLDEEARDARWFLGAPEFGRLKEPVHRALAIARAGNVGRYTNLLWWTWGDFNNGGVPRADVFAERVQLFPPGLSAARIADAVGTRRAGVSDHRQLFEHLVPEQALGDDAERFAYYGDYSFPPDYADLLPVSGDAGQLVDQVNLLFCGGSMSADHAR